MKGFRGGSLVRTGESTFCIIGEWAKFQNMADARPPAAAGASSSSTAGAAVMPPLV